MLNARLFASCRRAVLALGLGLSLGVVGCASGPVQDTTLTLDFSPMTGFDTRFSPRDGGIGSVETKDQRGEDLRVGLRVSESDGSRAKIHYSGDAALWLKTATEQTLRDAGLKLGVADGPVLTLTLDELEVSEEVYVNATYDGTVVVTARLVSAGGKELWSGMAKGFAENYGSAGSQENYAETINHALVKALAKLFSDPAFTAALGKS